jgi:hypothetical protein
MPDHDLEPTQHEEPEQRAAAHPWRRLVTACALPVRRWHACSGEEGESLTKC